MAATADKLTLADFERQYGDEKPHYEYWFGEAVQKATPSWVHALLQKIIMMLLDEAGYRAGSELTLKISADFEPVPDVAATMGLIEGSYPTRPVDNVVEILSPTDSFHRLMRKCSIYAEWGISTVAVLDPEARVGWVWDNGQRALRQEQNIGLPNGKSISVARIFQELDKNLQ